MTPQTTQQRQAAARDAHPDAWIAVEEGDTISGTVVDVSAAWSDQREADYPLLTIATDDGGEKKVHCFSTVLYNEVLRQRPVIGERVTITYMGVGEARKRGQSGAKLYRFRVEGRSPEQIGSLYDRLDGQGKPQAQAPPSQPATADVEPEDSIPF